MRVAAGRPVALQVWLDDDNGLLVDSDAGHAVTVRVQAGDGSDLVAAGTATSRPSVPPDGLATSTGVYQFVLPGQARLDALTVTWSATLGGFARTEVQTVNIVGPQRLATLPQLVGDKVLGKLTGAERLAVLEVVEEGFANILGYPAVQEGVRTDFMERRFAGSGSGNWGPGFGMSSSSVADRLLVPGVAYPQQVYSLQVNPYAFSSQDLALIVPSVGILVWEGRNWPAGHYQMWCAHGLDRVPADLKRAAFTAARYLGRGMPQAGKDNGSVPERVASITTDGATILFSMPSPDRPTGLPEVDAVLNRYRTDSVI